jgi:methionine-gamma-lyase
LGGVLATIVVYLDERLRFLLKATGGVPSPFDNWILLRSTKTLGLRYQKSADNAVELATWLCKQKGLDGVLYPGLNSHPQHEIAKKQMQGFGGMISFELNGGLQAGKTLMDNVHLCTLAVSLGGVETLIQHPATMTHASMGPEARAAAGITDGLVRISVGVEEVEEILDDLRLALKNADLTIRNFPGGSVPKDTEKCRNRLGNKVPIDITARLGLFSPVGGARWIRAAEKHS